MTMSWLSTEYRGEPITRIRGDTAPDVIFDINKATGLPFPTMAAFAYRLTVNTIRDPSSTTPGTVIAAINGIIVDLATGRVQFPWTPAQADAAPGKYWYDIQRTDDAGSIKTIAKTKYTFKQDITK